MGSVGATRNTVSSNMISYRQAYQRYQDEINSASELTINPDNGHAYFSALEAPITPIIEDFVTVKGTDAQLINYYSEQYPGKMVNI